MGNKNYLSTLYRIINLENQPMRQSCKRSNDTF